LNSLAREPAVAEVAVTAPAEACDDHDFRKMAADVQLVETRELLTFARASNLAARATTAPYVLFLNDDTVIRPGAIERLADVLDDEPNVGLVAPKLLNLDGSLQGSIYFDLGPRDLIEVTLSQPILTRWSATKKRMRFPRATFPELPANVDWASGAALMIRRDLLDKIGGFDEGYPHGMEDAALCREARHLGLATVVVPGSVVEHAGGSSGYRSLEPAQLQEALVRGALSWDHYWVTYRRPFERVFVWLAYLALAASRILILRLRATATGRQKDAVRAESYARAARRLIKLWLSR
jgi:GT2 family glycosyltransferase